jgi:hypothetical protein
MAGTSVKLRFGFCNSDIKAAPSRHFHHHRWLRPASQLHAEPVISSCPYFFIINNSASNRD